MLFSVIAVITGASIGALLRWALGLLLDPLAKSIGAGILTSNLVGAYFFGLCFFYLAQQAPDNQFLKLFLITGLLGSLTTFSSFSLEILLLLQIQKYFSALFVMFFHTLGSVLMAYLGFLTANFITLK